MGGQSEEVQAYQAGLDACTNLLQTIVALEKQLNNGYTSADLEKFTQERSRTFSQLKLHLESLASLAQNKGPLAEEILARQLAMLKEIDAVDKRVAAKLAEEIANTRLQLSHCRRIRSAVRHYKAGGNPEARFIDKQR